VTNTKGEGVQAALGLQIVDQAVFALAEKQPGFAKVFFYLETGTDEAALRNPFDRFAGRDFGSDRRGVFPARSCGARLVRSGRNR